MKKIVLLGLLAVICGGCGRGWSPLRGDRCGKKSCLHNRLPPPPAAADPCTTCPPATSSASYGSYDNVVLDGDAYSGEVYSGDVYSGDVYGGEVISNDYYPGTISNGTVIENTPTMVPANPSIVQ